MKPLLLKYSDIMYGVCKHLAAVLFCTMSALHPLTAQNILLKNPSLEGTPGQGKVPPSWRGRNTPDIQPGTLNITQPASDGATYIGLHSGPAWLESISQEVPLIGGKSYTVSMDLAYAPEYAFLACYANLTVYGGNAPSDTAERLASTGAFFHTNWKRYTFVFHPTRNYKFITFMADPAIPCDKSIYGSALLIDNISAALLETPQLSLTLKHTCKGERTGEASVSITGVTSNCTIRWSPGGETTSRITGLAPGDYEVTVTHPNGVSVTKRATIIGKEVKSKVTVTPSPCYGDNDNTIALETDGGTPPYRYYFNGSTSGTYTSSFPKLSPGNYSVLVKDEENCAEQLDRIEVVEPSPVSIAGVRKKDVSCTTTMDGKIMLDITGGTPPYAYSLDNGHWQGDSSWSGLDAGTFHFKVKDAHSCEVDGSADIIRNVRECAVFVPTAFSPNGDGQNDLFRAKVHDDVHDYKLEVYTRWGQTVFSTNSPDGAWDGLFKGKMLPTAAYVWVLLYTDSKQQARKQTGSVMLIR
ncbi:T9SS type B sorting domain-containing protein [Chitinophaga ginsengisegetis]|uniref:T9SS type B sorting domain-containing protein n=1 Tax=Chitinophaga ginsengisegetis TaxID=393003 RepID=UPI000DB985C1|nr:gliding motility-associated C-terminal domain-containing protein [Chitinophaga ginsengisegetis]MDR6569874.1 gliding motility-associated-like protein [Chitinophaga ginsengisegetis]MDR6649607.1 gliding motility-associated-like protein [Chitinophaga ginsengisegetis]MDR6656190.1 gliding motility-associated-like protein [Chitinophaga ginsengisegetis]